MKQLNVGRVEMIIYNEVAERKTDEMLKRCENNNGKRILGTGLLLVSAKINIVMQILVFAFSTAPLHSPFLAFSLSHSLCRFSLFSFFQSFPSFSLSPLCTAFIPVSFALAVCVCVCVCVGAPQERGGLPASFADQEELVLSSNNF